MRYSETIWIIDATGAVFGRLHQGASMAVFNADSADSPGTGSSSLPPGAIDDSRARTAQPPACGATSRLPALMNGHENLVPIVAMLLCALLWGTGVVTYKIALASFDPLQGAFGRQGVGLLMFALVFGSQVLRIARTIRRSDWLRFSFVGLCEPCLYFVFYSYGLRLTSPGQAGVIMATVPMIVTLTAWMVLGERPRSCLWYGLGVAFVGMAGMNLLSAPTVNAPDPVLGNLLLLGGCVCSAGYMVGLKKFDMPYPMLFSAAFQACSGTVFFGAACLLDNAKPWPALTPVPWFCLLYTGVAVTFGVYTLFNFCIPRLPMGQVTAFINLVPVITMATSAVLGELLSLPELACCALILGGVVLSQRKP